jgi:glycosyltransferase involved in cell wall biosynthesis
VSTTVYTLANHGKKISEKRFQGARIIRVNPDGFDDVPVHLSGWLKASWCVKTAIHDRENLSDYDLIEHFDFGALAYFLIREEWHKGQQLPLVCSSVNPSFNTSIADKRDRHCLPEYILGEAEKFVLLASREVWLPTNSALAELRSKLPHLSETSVLSQPLPRMCCAENRKPFENRAIDLLFFGRQQTIKGFDLFVRALSILWQRNPQLLDNKNIAVLGNEHVIFPQSEPSIAFASRILGENFKKLQFLGLKSEVCSILNESKNICCPSRSDFGPNAVIESLQHNANIVVPAGGAGHEIASLLGLDEHAFQFEKGEVFSLADAIEASLLRTNRISLNDSTDDDWKERIEKFDYLNIEKRVAFTQSAREANRDYPAMLSAQLGSSELSRAKVDTSDISAVIPLYNQSNFLTDSIKSLIDAGVNSDKIFVVNDGSTEQQSKVAQEICNKFQVNYFFRINRGLSAARNKGLSFVTTNFVIFLDADDRIEPTYPFKALNILGNFANVAAVGSWIRCFGDQNSLIPTWDANSSLYLYKNTLNSAGLIWRTSTIRSIGGFSEEFNNGYEDYDACARILNHGWAIPIIDEALFNYRVKQSSMFKSLSSESHRLNYTSILSAIDEVTAREVIALTISNGNPLTRTSIFFGNSFGVDRSSDTLSRWVLLKHFYNNSKNARKLWRLIPSRFRNYALRKFLPSV